MEAGRDRSRPGHGRPAAPLAPSAWPERRLIIGACTFRPVAEDRARRPPAWRAGHRAYLPCLASPAQPYSLALAMTLHVTARRRIVRASPAPQAEIRCYLAPNGCKFRPGETYVSSGEPRGIFEFKLNKTKNVYSSAKYRDIYIYRVNFTYIGRIRNIFKFGR
jgi:hypothetical protein